MRDDYRDDEEDVVESDPDCPGCAFREGFAAGFVTARPGATAADVAEAFDGFVADADESAGACDEQ